MWFVISSTKVVRNGSRFEVFRVHERRWPIFLQVRQYSEDRARTGQYGPQDWSDLPWSEERNARSSRTRTSSRDRVVYINPWRVAVYWIDSVFITQLQTRPKTHHKSFHQTKTKLVTMKSVIAIAAFAVAAVSAGPLAPRAVTEFDVSNFAANCRADNTGCT